MNDFKINDKLLIPWDQLAHLLPDVETALFFAKLYQLNAQQVTTLLDKLFHSDVTEALASGSHSEELQDYVIDLYPELQLETGSPAAAPNLDAKLLTEVFEAATIEVATSVRDVAAKLGATLGHMPSQQGQMVFKSLREVNARRPTLGAFKAQVYHPHVPDTLVILDVSGSMTEETIRTIVDDAVALAYNAKASLAIVSNTATLWEPGTFDAQQVLDLAEFGGTQYEQLVPLFARNWGTVICIADYDSHRGVKELFGKSCTGIVGEVFDISLVAKQTFLSECVGVLSNKPVRRLMQASPAVRLCW